MLVSIQCQDDLKLLYREVQKYEVMTKCVVVGEQKKKHANPSSKATKYICIDRTFLTSDYY